MCGSSLSICYQNVEKSIDYLLEFDYRDRTPFVLTPDMAYVINGGDKPTQKFQDFVDLCCGAFNAIRENADGIITLLKMVSHC